MPRLNTKLWRELARSKWQFIAVTTTVILGIAFFQGALISYGNLGKSYDLTYRRLAFGDVWVRMAVAPDSLVRRVARLSGVEVAIGRIVEEVRLELPGVNQPAVTGRIISLPEGRQPAVNQVRIVEGGYFTPQGGRQALLEISFARAHDLHPGDFVYPVIGGDSIRFRIVGLAQSPEYIYSVQSKQYLVPTPDTFGVLFIPEQVAESLFGMGSAINEICLITASGRRQSVARLVQPLTDRYGGEEPITRDEQPSNKLLTEDLRGYRQMAVIFPLLFLTGTVLTTYTLFARLVQAQAVQIGVLRATGFTQRAILGHFLALAAIPAVLGGMVGVGFGYLFALWISRLYQSLINIPYLFYNWQPPVTAAAFAIALAAGLVGAYLPAQSAARLPPAQAMSQQAAVTERLPAAVRLLGRGLPLALKLPLRNVLRRPTRAVYTVLGIVLGIVLMVLSLGILDGVNNAIRTYFEQIERYDVAAAFVPEQPGRIITQIAAWPAVAQAEPTLDIAIEVERRGVLYSTILTGLPPGGELRQLTTPAGRRAVPAPGEALIGRLLVDKFHVAPGDRLTIRYAQNRPEFHIVRTVVVGPPIESPVGASVYMRLDDVERLFARPLGLPVGAVSGALIRTKPGRLEWVRRRLDRLPVVAAVQTRRQSYQQIQDLMRFSRLLTRILALFGVGLAFAVVFTSVSISVLERTRELATLRTLGFGLARIATFITTENLFLAVVGIALGLPLGRRLDFYLVESSQTESVTLEPVIFLQTYLAAIASVFLLVMLSQVPSFIGLRRLNLAAATKEIGT